MCNRNFGALSIIYHLLLSSSSSICLFINEGWPLSGTFSISLTDLKKGLDRATSIQKLRPKLSAVAMFDGTTLLIVHYRGDAYHERNRREEFDL